MAEVVAYSQDTQQRQPSQRAPHGKKRAADNGLENEQRLSKRFDLLNLGMHPLVTVSVATTANSVTVEGNGRRLYIPVAGSTDAAVPSAKPLQEHVAPVIEKKPREKKPRVPPPDDDCMQVEDTPHRVYIHDLAAELSDIESDEENPIFLADIEKHLAKIPKHVLTGPELKPTKDNQLILYAVPSSLTIPEEQDRVRKAIVEARARVRERQVNPIGEPEGVSGMHGGTSTTGNTVREDAPMDTEEDADAMEID